MKEIDWNSTNICNGKALENIRIPWLELLCIGTAKYNSQIKISIELQIQLKSNKIYSNIPGVCWTISIFFV